MIKYFCVQEEDTTGVTTWRKRLRHIRGREIVNICSKCMQAFEPMHFWKDGGRRR